jgi:hypothetical protein
MPGRIPPTTWGPFFWHTIHIIALGYPKNPTYTDKKCVKEFYESLTLYHQTKETNTEVYVPLVIAEPVAIAHPIANENPFVDYQYVEVQAQSELSEEKYDEDTPPISTVKIIKIT